VDNLEDADHVIILGDDGVIAQQGSFNHVQSNPYLQSLRNPPSISGEKGEASKTERAPAAAERQAKATPDPRMDDEQKRRKKASGAEGDAEDLLNRTGDTSLYWYYLKTVGWRFAGLALSLGILAAFSHLFPRGFIIPYGGNIFQGLLTAACPLRSLAETLGGSQWTR
jgi:ATP-binding cassette, subfamily C (CFTR/MRP), member 1